LKSWKLLLFLLIVALVPIAKTDVMLEKKIGEFQRSIQTLRQNPGRPEDFTYRLYEHEKKAFQLAFAALRQGNKRIGNDLMESALQMKRIRIATEGDPSYFYLERSYGIRRELKRIEAKTRIARDDLLPEDGWIN
jgi:hypothetical protein